MFFIAIDPLGISKPAVTRERAQGCLWKTILLEFSKSAVTRRRAQGYFLVFEMSLSGFSNHFLAFGAPSGPSLGPYSAFGISQPCPDILGPTWALFGPL